MLGGGGVAGRGLSFGDGGGFGSFLCLPKGLFGRIDGLGAVADLPAGVGDSQADAAVPAVTVFVGVWWDPGREIPRPESGVLDGA